MKLLSTQSVSEATAIKGAQSKSKNLNKAIALNSNNRIFFRMVQLEDDIDDIMAAALPGRMLDSDRMGSSFIALRDFDQDAGGKIIDNTSLNDYARMSRILHDASKANELVAAEAGARAVAANIGTELTEKELQEALAAVVIKYEGIKKEDGTMEKYPEVRQLVGGISIEVATEVVIVPVNGVGQKAVPEWSKAVRASITLSNTKIEQLKTIYQNDENYAPGSPYLEIAYEYKGKDATEAGRQSVFAAVPTALSLANKFPKEWEKHGEKIIGLLAKTPEEIAGRNYKMSSSTTPSEVIASFQTSVAKSPQQLRAIDFEAEETKRMAKQLLQLTAMRGDAETRAKLMEIVATEEAKDAEDQAQIDYKEELDAVADTMAQINAAGSTSEMVAIAEGSGKLEINDL